MTDIPETHPRYRSLVTREALVEGVRDGLVAPEGLIAHGRGEAFDYLLGEETAPPASAAARAAAAHLLLADRAVISVNGNTAVLAAREVGALARATGALVEVNLFHRTEQRVRGLVDYLAARGVAGVLGQDPDARIPGLDHARSLCSSEGIHAADVVLVPLEDGDRCQALRDMGKTVVVIDLNPLSRTSRTGTVTVVDELTRALPAIQRHAEALEREGEAAQRAAAGGFDNGENLQATLRFMAERLRALDPAGDA